MMSFLAYTFFQRALLAGVCIGILAPMIGVFFVARRQAFFADTLAHASLAGVALGLLFGGQHLAGSLIASIVAAWIMHGLRSRAVISGDAALSLVLSGSLSLAVVVLSISGAWNAQALGYLFGSITTVTWNEVFWIFSIGGISAMLLWAFRHVFFLLTEDPRLARVQGIAVDRYELLFATLSALIVGVSIRVVGALLVSALLVIPVLAANVWRRGFWNTQFFAMLYGVASVIIGLFLSAWCDVPAGASMILVSLGLFLATLGLRRVSA